MGVYPCFIAYPLIYKTIVKGNKNPGRIVIASILSVIVALELGAFSVVMQTLLSGRTELPFAAFASLMLPIHLAIAVGEGIITGGFINYVRTARPEVFDMAEGSGRLTHSFSMKKALVSIAILAIVTGGIMSWFASTHPDGLEWSIEKIYGTAELPASENGITTKLKDIQEKTAILPDYDFAGRGNEKPAGAEESWPVVNTGTTVSGVLGCVMVTGLIIIFGFGIKAIKKFI